MVMKICQVEVVQDVIYLNIGVVIEDSIKRRRSINKAIWFKLIGWLYLLLIKWLY